MTKPKEMYWWFQGASVVELNARLNVDPFNARLEVRVDDDQRMTFRVVTPGIESMAEEPDVNDSHRCPPQCPE